jgi:dihydropyrimidinase
MPESLIRMFILGFCQGFERIAARKRGRVNGGVTTIGCFLAASSATQTFPDIEKIFNTHAFTDVFPHICINTEEQKQEIPAYVNRFGLTSFKFFMFCIPGYMPSQTNSFILSGLRQVANCGPRCFASIHAEDPSILTEEWNKFFQSGKKSLAEWAAHNPVAAEVLGVTMAASLAEMSTGRVNIVHLATGAALERLRAIKRTNPSITVETIALYLSLNTSSDVDPEEARWSPAVRSPEDQEALWRGVSEGTISSIGTDQDCVDRKGLHGFIKDYGVSGSSAVTALLLPLLLTEGYHKRGVPLKHVIEKVTLNPARLWDYPRRHHFVAVRGLVLVDINRSSKWTTELFPLRIGPLSGKTKGNP